MRSPLPRRVSIERWDSVWFEFILRPREPQLFLFRNVFRPYLGRSNILFLDLFVDLLTVNGHVFRRANPEADLLSAHFEDDNLDLVTNNYALVNLSR